ncbi:MAG: hypothetical protein HY290_18505 [Planctomycetia bacterium]|nr:hypothetical protein [Planctomycetia bacterium]
MYRTLPFLLCGYAVCLVVGCEHMAESRVVHRFAESIREHDLAQMKAGASSDFEDRAVKGYDTFRALKLIELPEGMPKVVSVRDIKDDKKKVVQKKVWTTVGKDKRRVAFMLKPDGKSGKWVVDDIYLSKADLDNNRSVAQRLAVLLSLQESLDAWKAGSRDQILAAATPEFAQSLAELSPLQVEQFARKITGDLADTTRILGDERIGDETAELAIARPEADLVMAFRRDGSRWRLDDLAVKARRTGDGIASARLVAGAMSSALKFEHAYSHADKRTLQEVCTARFYNGCLASADLATVSLPQSEPGLAGFDIKLEEKMATFIVPSGNEWLKISLALQPVERLHAAPRYLVDEVTIYDQTQDKRLSALFTARATLETFCAALARRDLKSIRQSATHDFNERVWEQAAGELLGSLPTAAFAHIPPRLLHTRFEGSLTEMMVEHGETPVTYRLRDEGGRILVDDLVTPASGWPESAKAASEALLPVLNFRVALRQSQMDGVRAQSSREFLQYAWKHFDEAPKFDVQPEEYFKVPLTRIERMEDRASVQFGDDRFGARFELVRERGQFVVDDVTLISGRSEDQRIALKRTIRTQLAEGDQPATAGATNNRRVQPAAGN